MITVMVTNSTVSAISEGCLISSAVNIIQEDKSNSRTKDPAINIDCYCICKLEKQQITVNRILHGAASKLALKLKKSKMENGIINLHSVVRPSCLHTTLASLISQSSSHTVPHCPRKHTSTRPSKLFLPPTSRISVLLQAASTDIQRQNILQVHLFHK